MSLIVSLDLEFNQPSKKIIQIGAVLCNLGSGATLRWFSCFVNPEETLAPRITRLTGIQQPDVDTAPGIGEAYQQLVDWLDMWHVDRPVAVLTWGADDAAILREAVAKNTAWCFSRSVDVKDPYIAWRASQHPWVVHFMTALGLLRPWIGDLERCVRKLGMQFEGRPHNALDDAINTFRAYVALQKGEIQ